MEFSLTWLQENALHLVAASTSLLLVYLYLIDKDHGVKLSKKYRNSIFEAQSKIFLNATQYLISGNKDLAIKEFLNAVDLNRETIDTYFALGGLFRSNGEIEKAISIHRSLIARDNISESTRLEALKELAVDFDKGGFLDKAIDTYKDVLKINRDQGEVIHALCKIYEDIEEWDMAYNYRIMLSKVSRENQSETISHILVQKAKVNFERGKFQECSEDLEDAFKFAPSVSAKILRLKLFLVLGNLDDAKLLFMEILKEHPMYASSLFVSLREKFNADEDIRKNYDVRLGLIQKYFLNMDDMELFETPSVVLSKIRLLKEEKDNERACEVLKNWISENKQHNDFLQTEYIKLLIELDQKEEALAQTKNLLENFHGSMARYFCNQCGYNSDNIFWRCPQCHQWETMQFRWKV